MKQVEATGLTLEAISKSMTQIATMDGSIVSAAEEQTVVANGVRSSVDSIPSLLKSTMTYTVSAEETSKELENIAANLDAMAKRFFYLRAAFAPQSVRRSSSHR